MNLEHSSVLFCLVTFCGLSCGLDWAWESPNKDMIEKLPGLERQPSFRQYSGYLRASGSKMLHYWFVESQRNPEKDPVVLWLNGGPGCSSLDGFLSEHGPFLVNRDGKTLRYNTYSWNKVANMLYLESPAGVGFSFSPDKNYTTDDDLVSGDNFLALLDFFKKFPQLRQNPFFVTGESYAGIYVPTLSLRIFEGRTIQSTWINMKGFAVGNGLSSYGLNSVSSAFFAYYHGLIGDALWEELQRYCFNGTNSFLHKFSYESLECEKLMGEVFYTIWDIGLNAYSLYHNCSGLQSKDVRLLYAFTNLFHPPDEENSHNAKVRLRVSSTPPCLDDTAVSAYLNLEAVRDALHIDERAPKWTFCSDTVKYKRLYTSMFSIYEKLLGHYRALVYNGDTDMACNFLGDQWFVNSLGLETVKEHRPWKYGNQIAGFVKDLDKLTFVTIKGAGHMVPTDKPAEALKMFSSFLENRYL